MRNELFLKFLGNCLKFWEYRGVLYAHCPEVLFLFLLVKQTVMELNHVLRIILANHKFLELNQ